MIVSQANHSNQSRVTHYEPLPKETLALSENWQDPKGLP